MWHTREIGQIFADMTKMYGYDILKSRKRCIALCGDLLAMYDQEKKVFLMLFQAGLGECLKDAPYRTERDAKIGISAVEKFLKNQGISADVTQNVVDVVVQAFVEESNMIGGSYYKPIICKNYNDIHFKLQLPTYVEYADHLEISSAFIYKAAGEKVDSLLEKCEIIDRFKMVISAVNDYHIFLSKRLTTKFSIDVPKNDKIINLTGAMVDLTFLCSDQKKIVVSFYLPKPQTWTLRQISIFKMTNSENEIMQRLYKLVTAETNLVKAGPADGSTVGKTGSNNNTNAPLFTSTNIAQYSDALEKEIYYLKQGKGKKYKVVNGEKLHRDNKGVYTYSFEMETELHLPDDAPVTIETSNGLRASGSVLLCDDFQIMLMLDRDLNDQVGTAYITVEPWKLLEALDKKLCAINPGVHKLAIKLIEDGPKLAEQSDIAKIPKGQQAVTNKLKKEDIVAVWGPPGTGKTYTMASIALNFVKRGKSVLIVSHSNVSVDGVIKQVLRLLDPSMKSLLHNGHILRYGYVRDTELANNDYATSYSYALLRNPVLRQELDSLSAQRDEMKAKRQTKTEAYNSVEKKIKGIREQIRKEEKKYAGNARLLGTTISKAIVDGIFDDKQYDLVMFDEVSMAYVPQVIVAATLSREKFMFVGDFRQLSPIAQSPAAKQILQKDIFSYLRIIDNQGKMYGHPWLVMLNEQRRMHPSISAFPNKYVYRNLLKDHYSVLHNLDAIIAASPIPGDAMNLIDLTGTYCAASKNNDNSRFNILSAIISFSTAVQADREGTAETVGIITPYAAQTCLIRAMVRDYYKSGTEKVHCATVHQFQGSESDVLIFDAVESYPTHKVGFLLGKDMDAVTRLINVAVTRARGKLITVANVRFWENTFRGTNHIYYRLLKHIEANHMVIDNSVNHNLKQYIETINPEKMICIFTDETDAIAQFEKDMQRATGKVVFSIPDGKLRENEFKILSIVNDTYDRGVSILMKSNGYKDLPDKWKEYCFGTDNAVFPLIVIDDKIAWYGLPTSRLQFQIDKTTAQNTVVQIMIRINGTNTIEMIKALTNLETVEAGSNIRALLPKKSPSGPLLGGDDEDCDMLSPGLAGFVEEKEFCPKCKNHMVLTRNARGTSYLKCSGKNCDYIKYLEKDLMNWYISAKNVKCPNDGDQIRGGIGKFGPYIRCDRGHFLKPWEI